MTTPAQIRAHVKHPSFRALPEDIQQQVKTTMQQAVRQQALTAAAVHVDVDDDALPGGGLIVTAHLDILPAGSLDALKRALSMTDAAAGMTELLTVARQLVYPDGPPALHPDAWDGTGFRPVRLEEGGLVVIPLAPHEVTVHAVAWQINGEVSVSPPEHVSRLDDVAFVLPDGKRRAPSKAHLRRSHANGETVYLIKAWGAL